MEDLTVKLSILNPNRPDISPSPQYIGFAEDMMLILFLVCILATLVTVHRATCYRCNVTCHLSPVIIHMSPTCHL